MILTAEVRAIGESVGIPALLHKLSGFCDLNQEHVNSSTTVSVSLRPAVLPSVHMKAKGNAARAVLYALDVLSDVRVVVCKQDETRQFYLNGMFDGVPMQIVSCSDSREADFIDSRVDWKHADWLGDLAVAPEMLRELAEYTP